MNPAPCVPIDGPTSHALVGCARVWLYQGLSECWCWEPGYNSWKQLS